MKAKESKITTFEGLFEKEYRGIASLKSTEFKIKAKSFAIGELIIDLIAGVKE